MTFSALGLLRFTQSTPAVHVVIEWFAYFLGARVYFRQRSSQLPLPSALDQMQILACTIFGAAAGAILLHIAESASWIVTQPMSAWISGKSVLGGFLGGTLGTEAGKKSVGWTRSTGDSWVPALVVGLVVGRMACQLSGTWDMTYGSPTGMSIGWDYGDGLPRYPTALIELIGVVAIWLALRRRAWNRPGQSFNAFLLGYCVLRFFIEFLKPPFGAAAPGSPPVELFAGLTAIQWTALAGTCWMAWRLRRPSTSA